MSVIWPVETRSRNRPHRCRSRYTGDDALVGTVTVLLLEPSLATELESLGMRFRVLPDPQPEDLSGVDDALVSPQRE